SRWWPPVSEPPSHASTRASWTRPTSASVGTQPTCRTVSIPSASEGSSIPSAGRARRSPARYLLRPGEASSPEAVSGGPTWCQATTDGTPRAPSLYWLLLMDGGFEGGEPVAVSVTAELRHRRGSKVG